MTSTEPTKDEYARALQSVRDVVTKMAINTSHGRRTRLENIVVSLTTRLAEVAQRPDEPDGDVVKFQKRFSGERRLYDFVGCRAANGSWYLSSRDTRHNKPLTWDELLDFVYDHNGSEKTLRVSTGWDYLIPRQDERTT